LLRSTTATRSLTRCTGEHEQATVTLVVVFASCVP
jgi:hypothetical protein